MEKYKSSDSELWASDLYGSEGINSTASEESSLERIACPVEAKSAEVPQDGSPGTPAPKDGPCSETPSEESQKYRASAIHRLAQVAAERQAASEASQRATRGRRQSKCKTLPSSLNFADLQASIANAVDDVRDSSCIIFDFDDTLFPTWYVHNVVKPSGLEMDTVMAPLFYQAMAIHAAVVKELLQTARKFARVAIVTLAARPWVHSITKEYWHGFDFQDLLSELEIPIYYGREHLSKADKRSDEEGVNLWAIAKRNAMIKCLRGFKRKSGCMASNVISIGDSWVERDAVHEVVWSMDGHNFSKAVLLADEPPIASLTNQLQILTPSIGKMVAIQEDFDLNMLDESDLSRIASELSREQERAMSI